MDYSINVRTGLSIRRFLIATVGIIFSVFALGGCAQGVTGVFASIEREEEIDAGNLVDNTFVARIAKAGGRYYAVAGTKLFRRSVDDTDWSDEDSPSGRSLAQDVAAITITIDGQDQDELYAVYRAGERDRYGLFRRKGSGSWDEVYSKSGKFITGIAGIDTDGDGVPDRLIATVKDSNDSDGSRSLIVDPQKSSRTEHTFSDWNDDDAVGDDIGASRPAGSALVAEGKLWISRNGLWYIEVSNLDNESIPLKQVRAPAPNLASIEYVGERRDGAGPDVDRLVVATLDGELYRSPELTGSNPEVWESDNWEELGDESRSFSDVLWVKEADLLLVATISYGGRNARGYFEATPNSAFDSVSLSEPDGNTPSTELARAGINRLVRPAGGDTVFALSASKGLWSTDSYTADEDPEWRWE